MYQAFSLLLLEEVHSLWEAIENAARTNLAADTDALPQSPKAFIALILG